MRKFRTKNGINELNQHFYSVYQTSICNYVQAESQSFNAIRQRNLFMSRIRILQQVSQFDPIRYALDITIAIIKIAFFLIGLGFYVLLFFQP